MSIEKRKFKCTDCVDSKSYLSMIIEQQNEFKNIKQEGNKQVLLVDSAYFDLEWKNKI
jgi:hypothetical protein